MIISWWTPQDERLYRKMLWNHRNLWDFVQKFIEAKRVRSVFEVGGGYSSIPSLQLDKYTLVDLNQRAVDKLSSEYPNHSFNCVNFHDYDILPHKKKYDLTLALAVIEHVGDWEDFLRKLIALESKYTIVSFFNGLGKEKTRIEPHKTKGLISFYLNFYSLKDVNKILEETKVKEVSRIEKFVRHNAHNQYEDVLIIERV